MRAASALLLLVASAGAAAVLTGDSPAVAAAPPPSPTVVTGNFTSGDTKADIALLGGQLFKVPMAASVGDGTFTVTQKALPVQAFAEWAQVPGVKVLTGDFDHDSKADIALLPPPGTSWWTSIPVAFSNGDGTFRITNSSSPDFTGWAQAATAQAVAGDFDKDGDTDIALTGGAGWTSIPVAFSNGDGSFTVTNQALSAGAVDFGAWATTAGIRIIPGDYDNDGRSDFVLLPSLPNAGWASIPVAFSNGDGSFRITNAPSPVFAGLVQGSGVRALAGDFDKDGDTDIALSGGSSLTIPLARSQRDGTFVVTNVGGGTAANFASQANSTHRVVVGDFDKDGRSDLLVLGLLSTLPVAFSNGDGNFQATDNAYATFADAADNVGVKALVADFSGDGATDVALLQPNATTIPMAIADPLHRGIFTIANRPALSFTAWAQPTNSTTTGAAASLDSVTVSGTAATLRWTDRTTTESRFEVYRRADDSSDLQYIATVAATDQAGTGAALTYTDTVTAGRRFCYEILNSDSANNLNYSNEVCTSATPALPPPPPPVEFGNLSIVDAIGSAGIHPSAAMGRDGRGIAAYAYNSGTGGNRLRVAHCSDVECTTVVTHDIDTVGSLGWFSSIAIGADGLPLISYTSQVIGTTSSNDLKVAHCVDVVCSSATVTTLDSAARVDQNTSLSIGRDGVGIIVYGDYSLANGSANVKVAHCVNTTCTSAFIATIGTNNFSRAVAASPSGMVYLAYAEGTDLKLMACYTPGSACLFHLTSTIAVGAGDDPSIAIGWDGLPLISYRKSVSGFSDLTVAHCANYLCTTTTTATVHVDGVSSGNWTSTAIGADGLGIIGYYDATNKNAEVAHCADVACTSLTHLAVDEFDIQGFQGVRITIGTDGLPLVTYQDDTNADLKVIHCGDAACTAPIIAPF